MEENQNQEESYEDFVKRTVSEDSQEQLHDDENKIDPAQVHPDENTDTQVVDAPPVPQHPAHPVDEDPEDHIGDETPDPWSDDDQKDWPNSYPAVVEKSTDENDQEDNA